MVNVVIRTKLNIQQELLLYKHEGVILKKIVQDIDVISNETQNIPTIKILNHKDCRTKCQLHEKNNRVALATLYYSLYPNILANIANISPLVTVSSNLVSEMVIPLLLR